MSLSQPTPSVSIPPRRAPVPVLLFVVLGLVALFFLGWRSDWFGRELTDEQIIEYLAPGQDPKRIQHALAQLETRLGPKYPGRERFRPLVVALKDSPHWEIRRQAAWVMGREPAEDYRTALTAFLRDEDPGVRLNAACALSNSNDAAARPVLLSALEPLKIATPLAGALDLKLKVGDSVSIGRALGTVAGADGRTLEIHAPFNGYVEALPAGREGAVEAGSEVAVISPDPESVLNALVALRYVGTKDDLGAIARFADGKVAKMPREVQDAAKATRDVLSRR